MMMIRIKNIWTMAVLIFSSAHNDKKAVIYFGMG